MDMPSSCSNCPCSGNNYGYNECELKGKRLAVEDIYEKRPSWCPLRELPEKANHPDWCDGGRYDKGYNACIDEILGDKE